MMEKTLYERLGGVFAIAAVVDHFSDAVVKNPIVGHTPRTRPCRMAHRTTRSPARAEVHADAVGLQRRRRTVRVRRHASGTDGHRAGRGSPSFRITPDEFDEVAAELARTLDAVGVPEREKAEVLGAFAAHKGEVTEGAVAGAPA